MQFTKAQLESFIGDEKQVALVGGAHEGAKRIGALADWSPFVGPADDAILPDKALMDARAGDMLRNDGYVQSASALHRDHIVGSTYLLDAKPNSLVLFGKVDEAWEEEFQEEVETKFHLIAESDDHWLDAQRRNTLTSLVRLAVAMHVATGEVLGSANWGKDDGRPSRSSLLMLDPARLCNPNHAPILPNIVGGVERDRQGAPIAYHILDKHPQDWKSPTPLKWRRVMARKPWGRENILHIYEQNRADQTRGISAIVSSLLEMKMTREFRKVELQRATIAATYAASIETELPNGDPYVAMGAGEGANPSVEWAGTFLEQLQEYTDNSNSLKMDGAKIPVFMPGTHLKLQNPGKDAPLGADFERSLLRYLAASFGVSYEQFARDYTQTNYSSARAAMNETRLHMMSRKKLVADRVANFVYRLWLEEAIMSGQIESAKSARIGSFHDGLNKDAYCAADWIGAGQGMMDPLKETQAASLQLRNGLTTLSRELANIHGADWRRVLKQRAREHAMLKDELKMPSPYDSETTDAENAATGAPREAGDE